MSIMQATDFECRHQTLLSQLILVAGLATYLFDPEDVVWRFIKDLPNRRELEHLIFFIASIFVGAGATLCTRARSMNWADDSLRAGVGQWLGELAFAVGIGMLLPLAGFITLVAGQAIRILRLARRQDRVLRGPVGWAEAMRREAAKWGLLVTMIIFSITLVDRHADALAGTSYLAWAVLNLPTRKPVSI